MRRRSIISLGIAMVAMSVASAASAAQLPAPGGFRLQASNGYTLRGLAYDGASRQQPDALLLFFTRKDSAVFYFARRGVVVTEETIDADLDQLGSIDFRFVPTGEPRDDAPGCIDEPVEVDSGVYEGRVDFEGEEGFTGVHATRARGDAKFGVGLICGMSIIEGQGGRAPGAQLSVHRRWSGGSLAFEAWKNSPTRPANFEASVEERRGALTIVREVEGRGAPTAFRFDIPKQRASLHPPSPFAGLGRFTRPGRSLGSLGGSLEVDFPGRANVALAGARGSLVRYVRNPAYPFRLNERRGSATLDPDGMLLNRWPSTKPSLTAFGMPSLRVPR